jgi:phosphatidylethanolamine/phosphatidyl-N-methylethanolamine N-methyltransferase
MLAQVRFLKAMLTDRRQTGAIAPSGRRLARVMVESLGPVAADETIVELGPGTGVFTQRLLEHHAQARLVAIEANGSFVQHLRGRLPSAAIVHGCATRIGEHLAAEGHDLAALGGIVSGLPLLSLPGDLSQRILAEVARVLPPGRRFVQFTYARRAWLRFATPGLELVTTRRVLANVPPASVLVFQRLPG